MQLIDGIPVWGDPVEESALSQIRTCARTADRAAHDGRPPQGLRRAHRRRGGLCRQDQPLRRRLRHRLRQQGRPPGYQGRRRPQEHRPDHGCHLFAACRSASARKAATAWTTRCSTTRPGSCPPSSRSRTWPATSSVPSAAATIRGRLHGRAGPGLDRRALRLARPRLQDRHVVPGKGRGARTAWTSIRS